ncbi:DUF4238 domain-containing protein [Pseudomonas poae]|uniref:DUF4238 domain-containing protein n=1 Tax=Pseudomonas poae TaxID=200451 RepID=UPI0034D634FA
MVNQKNDNHYVPQSYLKNWSIDGKVLTYRLLVPHENCELWKAHSPRSIAKHQYLYTYFSGTTDSDEIERFLDADFEGPATRSIAKVIKEEQLKPSDWTSLFRFVVAQSIRTPAGMQQFFDRQQRTLPTLLKDTMEASMAKLVAAAEAGVKLKLEPVDDVSSAIPIKVQTIKNADGTADIKAEILNGRKLWIWQLRQVLTCTIHRLPNHRWTILHAPLGNQWPTTDNPFVRLAIESDGRYTLDGGWGVVGIQLFIPLSPKHLLYTKVGARPPVRGTVLSHEEARFIRRVIIENAQRYIFATDRNDIAKVRPRTVSQDMCHQETEMWATWHREQSALEAEYPDLMPST